MANLRESPTWEAGIYQIEENDPVHGGADGVTNKPIKQLANRTLWLHTHKMGKNDNAVSATKLQATRTINGIAFDGTANITVGLPTFGGYINQPETTLADANIAPTQGGFSVRHLSSNTTNKPNGVSHSMMTCAYDDRYATQLAADWRTNKLYSRTLNNGTWVNWKELAYTDSNVASATKLATARNIAMTGDGSWNVNFDGLGNVSGTLTLANSGVTAGSYNSVTVDAKGRVTRGLTQTHGLVTATAATGTANVATGNTNTYLNIVASGVGQTASVGSSTQITGTNGISVSSDAAGKLIISQEIANTLTDNSASKSLSAAQGKVLDEIKLDKSGGVLTGTLYAANSGIKAAGDNDTGIEWVRDGIFRILADGRERLIIHHGGTTLRTQDGISLSLQNDRNLVLYDEQNRAVFSSNAVLAELANKVNKTGDTMTGHLRLSYINDWVGYSANNPTEGKHGFYDVAVNGIARGGMQIVGRGNGRYDTIIGITPAGETNTDRRVGGLTISQSGLHAHAYGHLHEYFLIKTENAVSASKLQTARTISLTGAVTGSVNFDGSGNVSIPTTLPSVANNVVVMTGEIEHGGTIPLPAGFSEAQCKWFVSISDDNASNRGWDIWESAGHRHYGFKCFTTGRVVTAQTLLNGHNSPPGWISAKASYIIIGIK